uniref:Zinc knuckle family protein n=1 Tax=Solanum tuberosum TaxID=4113 RepID=M1DCV3_SOLTU
MAIDICVNHPSDFWNRKKHIVTLPYKDNFSEDDIPTKSRPCQMNAELVEFCKKEIDSLLQKGLIKPSKSPWSCTKFYVNNAAEREQGVPRLKKDHKAPWTNSHTELVKNIKLRVQSWWDNYMRVESKVAMVNATADNEGVDNLGMALIPTKQDLRRRGLVRTVIFNLGLSFIIWCLLTCFTSHRSVRFLIVSDIKENIPPNFIQILIYHFFFVSILNGNPPGNMLNETTAITPLWGVVP